MQTVHKSKELGSQGSEVSKGNSGNGRKLVAVGHYSESGHVQGLLLVAAGDPVKHVNTLVTPKKSSKMTKE